MFPLTSSSAFLLHESIAKCDKDVAHENPAERPTVSERSDSQDHQSECNISQAIKLHQRFNKNLILARCRGGFEAPYLLEHHPRLEDGGESKRELKDAGGSSKIERERRG